MNLITCGFMNKIYFISCYFVPMGRSESNRAFMVKYLSEEGWDIEVIAGKNYKSLILNFQEDHSLWDVIPKNIKIHRFNGLPGWLAHDLKTIFHRPNNFREHWVKEAQQNLDLTEKGIIYAIIPPIENAVLAYRLACQYQYPLVLHFVDEVLGIDPKIIEHADGVISVTDQIQKNLGAHYNRNDIVVIQNGYLQETELPDKTAPGDPLRCVYAGSMTFRTRPEIFAQSYHMLMARRPSLAKKLGIDFYAPANYYPALFLKKYLNPNVRFRGFLPISRLLETLPQYDCALASTTGNISFTSKVYQYLNAGLPLIVSSEEPGLRSFVEERQIGLSTGRSMEAVAEKFEEFVQGPQRILNWRKRVIAIRSQFSLKKRIQEISQLLKRIPKRN